MSRVISTNTLNTPNGFTPFPGYSPVFFSSFDRRISRSLPQVNKRDDETLAGSFFFLRVAAMDRSRTQSREYDLIARMMRRSLQGIVQREPLRFHVEFIGAARGEWSNITVPILLRLDHPRSERSLHSLSVYLLDICFIEIIDQWYVVQRMIKQRSSFSRSGDLVKISSKEAITNPLHTSP